MLMDLAVSRKGIATSLRYSNKPVIRGLYQVHQSNSTRKVANQHTGNNRDS